MSDSQQEGNLPSFLRRRDERISEARTPSPSLGDGFSVEIDHSAELEKVRKNLEAVTDEKTRLSGDLDKAKATIGTITGERDQASKDLEAAKAELDKFSGDLKTVTDELDKANATIGTITGERD
ncbi:MAG: hypothetical protein JW816_01385, partial [Candidatus Buchananbacteria bacterium]|nr:hypothetical protein [Candidatus Buchananbacteria bacterium]